MIAACTETSSADVTSSQTSSCGLGDERAGDRDALALAARQLVRVAVEARRRERDALEGLAHLRPRRPCRPRRRSDGAAADDLRDRLPRVERAVRVLEHVLDLPAHVRVARSRPGRQRSSAKRDLAGVVRVQAGDAAGERGLAGARLADEREALARSHHEVDVVQHLPRSVRRVHAAHGDERVLDLDLGSRRRRDASCRGVAREPSACGCSGPRDRRTPTSSGGCAVVHAVLDVRAARCEEAARRAGGPGAGARARDADERVLARHVGDRLDEPARVRMRGRRNSARVGPSSTIRPAVHDRDAVGERRRPRRGRG